MSDILKKVAESIRDLEMAGAMTHEELKQLKGLLKDFEIDVEVKEFERAWLDNSAADLEEFYKENEDE